MTVLVSGHNLRQRQKHLGPDRPNLSAGTLEDTLGFANVNTLYGRETMASCPLYDLRPACVLRHAKKYFAMRTVCYIMLVI